MPALLVLEYCENGTLLEHVRGSDPKAVNTSTLLTYCHEVASALHYLSSRRIVHRDIAARNVSAPPIMPAAAGGRPSRVLTHTRPAVWLHRFCSTQQTRAS